MSLVRGRVTRRILATAVLLAAIVNGCNSAIPPATNPAPTASTASTVDAWHQPPTVPTPKGEIPGAEVLDRVTVGPEPAQLVAAGDSLWLADDFGVVRIGTDAGATTEAFSLGAGGSVASDGDTTWIGSYVEDKIARLDASTGRLDPTVSVTSPRSLAVGFGSVWVVSAADGSVRRFDAATGRVQAAIGIEDPDRIAAGSDAVWVSARGSAPLSRIDPATNDVSTVEVSAPGDVRAIAVVGDRVWLGSSDGTVTRYDANSHHSDTTSLELSNGLSPSILGIAADSGGAWLTGPFVDIETDPAAFYAQSGYAARVDGATFAIDDVRLLEAGAGPAAVTPDALWISVGFNDLIRIRARESAAEHGAPISAPDRSIEVRTNVGYIDEPGCSQVSCTVQLDAYSPRAGAPSPMVVLVPGAPSTFGSRRYLALLASALASRGVVVFAVDYRSAATGDADDQAVVDVACAIGFARSHAPEFGGDPSRVTLVGHSWGGRIAVEMARSKQESRTCPGASEPVDLVVGLAVAAGELGVVHATTPSNTAFRLFTGSADTVVPPCTDLAADLAVAGYDATCDIVEGPDHIGIWDPRSGVPTLAEILELASGR